MHRGIDGIFTNRSEADFSHKLHISNVSQPLFPFSLIFSLTFCKASLANFSSSNTLFSCKCFFVTVWEKLWFHVKSSTVFVDTHQKPLTFFVQTVFIDLLLMCWESLTLIFVFCRTLVVPYFHKHLSTRIVPPDRRINVNKLRNFVSCISVEELRRRCSNSFDVILKVLHRWHMTLVYMLSILSNRSKMVNINIYKVIWTIQFVTWRYKWKCAFG